MIVHRLSKAQYHTDVLEDMGIGAAREGGRWNSRTPSADRRLVYTSSSLSLAMLEVLVHAGGEAMRAVLYERCVLEIDDAVIAHLDLADVGTDWRHFSTTPQSQAIGDGWYDARASVALRVPSVLLPDGVYAPDVANYLINARHPDAADAVQIVAIEPVAVDRRLR